MVNDEWDRAAELRDSALGLIKEMIRAGYRENCRSGDLAPRMRRTPALEECLRDVDRACKHWQAIRGAGAAPGGEG